MKLKKLLKMIPNGTKIEIEYEGNPIYKSERFTKGKYTCVLLDHYDVKIITTINEVLGIVAVKPKERRKL